MNDFRVLYEELNTPFRVLLRDRRVCSLNNLACIFASQSNENVLPYWQSERLSFCTRRKLEASSELRIISVILAKGRISDGANTLPVHDRVMIDTLDRSQRHRFPRFGFQERCVGIEYERGRRVRSQGSGECTNMILSITIQYAISRVKMSYMTVHTSANFFFASELCIAIKSSEASWPAMRSIESRPPGCASR